MINSNLLLVDGTPIWGSLPKVLERLGSGKLRVEDLFFTTASVFRSQMYGAGTHIPHDFSSDVAFSLLRDSGRDMFVFLSPSLQKKIGGISQAPLIASLKSPLISRRIAGFMCMFTDDIRSKTHLGIINSCKHVAHSLGLNSCVVTFARGTGGIPMLRDRRAFVAYQSSGDFVMSDYPFASSIAECFEGLPLSVGTRNEMPIDVDRVRGPYSKFLNFGVKFADGCKLPVTLSINQERYASMTPGQFLSVDSDRYNVQYLRLDLGAMSINSRDPIKMHLVHPLQNRSLTLREIARISGIFDETPIDKMQSMHKRRDYALFYMSSSFPQIMMHGILKTLENLL